MSAWYSIGGAQPDRARAAAIQHDMCEFIKAVYDWQVLNPGQPAPKLEDEKRRQFSEMRAAYGVAFDAVRRIRERQHASQRDDGEALSRLLLDGLNGAG